MAEGRCSAFEEGAFVCKNGFVQKRWCDGFFRCNYCGETSKNLPYCLYDELPPHFVDESGHSRFKEPQ